MSEPASERGAPAPCERERSPIAPAQQGSEAATPPEPGAPGVPTMQGADLTQGAYAPRSVKRRIALALAILAVGFAVWFFAIHTPDPRDDFGRFQGGWQLAVPAGSADNGKPAARRTAVVVRVVGDRWVFLLGETEQKKYVMTLRPEADPKEIDLTQLAPDDKPLIQKWPSPERPVTLRGIYAVERDRARVVTAPGNEPRPTSLDATDGVTVWLLERAP